MAIGTVFINNRTQAVRLPLDVRLPVSDDFMTACASQHQPERESF